MSAASETSLSEDDSPVWATRLLLLCAALIAAHWLVVAQAFAPLHFDEAQYWTYGEELAGGYYSKPPLAAWIIRASTEIFGDTIFGVRAPAPLIHVGIALLLFATGRRLFDARTGFWAGAVYLAAPGVVISSGLMTTDPPMMLAWAAALYVLARILEAREGRAALPGGELLWWALLGAAVGAGLLAKYTMVAFVGGALGYALFSTERPAADLERRNTVLGLLFATLAALIVFSPNLVWNAQNGFASFLHLGDNAKLGGGPSFRIDKAGEFFGAQFGVFGPVGLCVLIAMAAIGSWRRIWRAEWRYRLLFWMAAPLPLIMTVQAFLSRAHPNWAAPAYVAGALIVAAWLLDRGRAGWLKAALGVGLAVFIGAVGAASQYAQNAQTLPRVYDPYKKMRVGPPICERALAYLDEGRLLASGDRRLLADCMFIGGLGTPDIRIWAAPGTGNHYAITAPLTQGEAGPYIFVDALTPEQAAGYLNRFGSAEVLESGEIRTHADRTESYFIAETRDFEGY